MSSRRRVVALAEQLGACISARGWVVFTGMGQARNVINVLSADVGVVCGGGGPGTASEAAHALNGGRPLILLAVPPPVAGVLLLAG